MSSIVKPYAFLPTYANVAYVDGKLEVAASIVANTSSEKVKANWMETIDILLVQRQVLASIENGGS